MMKKLVQFPRVIDLLILRIESSWSSWKININKSEILEEFIHK